MRKHLSSVAQAISLCVIVSLAVADGSPDDQQILAQAAAARPESPPPATTRTVPPQASDRARRASEGQTTDLTALERQARIDATVATARLELVLSRKALRDERYEDAAGKAQRVLALLRQLPPHVDVSVYELQAEGILAKAARKGVNVSTGSVGVPPDVGQRRRPAGNAAPDRYSYRPAGEIVDADVLTVPEDERLYRQAALEGAYRESEARVLVEADEARVVPGGVISYPDNWPEIVRKREKYRGGMIARSPSWYDKDGREWYVAVYDIHDLILVPPDFTPPMQFNPGLALRDALDRDALRWRSHIFRGGAANLAAGIPLLRYFGGVDDMAFRGPKYSMERQREIVEIIKAFTGTPDTGAKVVPLGP